MAHNIQKIDGRGLDRLSDISVTGRFISIGKGESNGYTNSAASSFNTGAALYFYDTNPLNNITNATITSANDWVSSVTLPAGSYLFRANFSPTFNASGTLSYVLYDGSNYINPTAEVGAASSCLTSSSGVCEAAVTIGSTTTFSYVAYNKSNINVSSQGNSISEQSFWIIEAL